MKQENPYKEFGDTMEKIVRDHERFQMTMEVSVIMQSMIENEPSAEKKGVLYDAYEELMSRL